MDEEQLKAAAAAIPTDNQGEAAEQNSVQKRIDQITGQRHAAVQRAEAAEGNIQALTQQVLSLQNTLQSQNQQVAQAPAVDPVQALLGHAAPKAGEAQAAPIDIAGMIKSAVGEALSPVMQKQQADADAQVLHDAQSRNYQEAATEYLPQALVQGSTEQQTFDAIFQSSQALQLDPNGPSIALAAVAGILGNRAGQVKVTEARKQAASTPTPNSPLARIDDLPGKQITNQQGVQALATEGAERGLDQDSLAALIGLKTGRAKLQ